MGFDPNHAVVEADALLQPTSADAGDNDTRLVITVRLSGDVTLDMTNP
jgi:hypothetical protein